MTRPFRSVLFAPGNRADMVAKLPRTGPDAAVIDLEDATPTEHKVSARATARRLTDELAESHPGLDLFVRVNHPDSDMFDGDISEALSQALTGVIVPKLAQANDVDRVVSTLAEAGFPDLPIMAGLETVAGIVDAVGVTSHQRVGWCYFGAEDYVADLGGVRRSDNLEVLFARSQVAQAARLGEIPAMDMVVTNFEDVKRFASEAAEARALGFSGKLCVHPNQVALANEAFLPTPEELAWASRVVDAYKTGLAKGEAAIAVDGEMIDEPVVRRARAILDAAD
ncbi:MAG: CoA ester lyase [Actinomycetota bacterium]|nr:CoA ester lyase [Actinomycetota bacterium]